MSTGKVKGVLLSYLADYVNHTRGAAAWPAALGALAPGDQDVLRGIVLPASWYPVGVYNRAVDRVMGPVVGEGGAAMRAFADYVADRDLNSFIKMMLRVGTPEFILGRTGWLWARYFDQGRFGGEQVQPRRWRMWLEAPHNADECAGELTCIAGVGPWLERGLRLSGAASPRVQHGKCRFQGAPRCEYLVQWGA